MMTSSFLPEPSTAKELFPNSTNVVADIPFPMDETNIASTSKVNHKHSARAHTRRHSKEGSLSKTNKTADLLMVILRGLPGSGKTSMAADLVARATHGVVLSSDDYFVRDGKYEWRHEDLGRAHEFNQDRAQREVDKKTQLVVIDNTNVTAWEMRPYVEMATKAGYEVRLVEPNTPWSFDSRELARRNSHGVDIKKIRNMMDRYESGLEIEDLLERWDLVKFSCGRDSSLRGDGGWEDSRGFSFEPLMDIEEDHGHFGSSAQSRENSIREKNKHGKVSRWDQPAGNVDNLPQNIEPPNLNWSLIKESITALPGLTPNKNPFDGRNIPTFSVNKHISGVLPSTGALPFESNSQNNDILPFTPNTPSFGGNNQNPNMPAGLPSSGRNQHDIDNRQASGILPLKTNNQTSRILPFGDNYQTSGILPSGDSNQPSGGINQVPAVTQVLSISQFCDRSQPPVINQATTPFSSNNLAPSINQTPGILPFHCNNQIPVPIPFANQMPAISPFDNNNQGPLIAPFVHNQLPATSPFDSKNQAPPIPPFVHNKMAAISPFGDIHTSAIGFHSIKPTAAILAFVNNNPSPDLPSSENPDPSSLFGIKNTSSETPLVCAGDKNSSKKKSRWKERAAAFLKTKELPKQSDVQSQIGRPKDDANFQQEIATPKLNEAKLPSPEELGQVKNASKGEELLPSISVEQIIPTLMSTDSKVIRKTFPPPKTIENDLPFPESSEKLLPTLNSEEELPSTAHAVESNDDHSNDFFESTDNSPENDDDATKAHDEADNIPGLTELSPKSGVRPFNIVKPFKLPSAFSFLQMDPTKHPNKTKEKENANTEVSEAETPMNQTFNTTSSSSDEIPPLPPPSDMPPLPFDPNDPDALPPPPPSPSVILLPPTPVSPSSIDLPSMPAPVTSPPPSPSNINLPDELSLIPQPPPPAEPCAVEDIPIPTCTGFNFSITGVQQCKMSRIGIKNPNSFGALMMARKRIKENKNIFKEEDGEISNADDIKNNDINEIIDTSQKQEATSFGKIDNKRITENTIKNEHEIGEELKVILKEPSTDPEHTENVESNIDDIFPLSKDGYVKAGCSKKEIKNRLASKQTSKDSKIVNPPDIECLTPVDPKLRCKLRASKVLTSLGNPTPELVNPVIDVKNDEPKKPLVLYGGYVTKLANKDELETFKTASSATRTPSQTETKSEHKSTRRSKSPKYVFFGGGEREHANRTVERKYQKERRSRSHSRSHSPRNKKTLKLARSEIRSHSPRHGKKSNRPRSRSQSKVYSTEIKRSKRTRSRSKSIVYSEIKRSPKRSQSRSRVDNSLLIRISGNLSRSGSFERKVRMLSRSRSTSIERRNRSKRTRSTSRQRKVKSRSQSRSGSAERKMSKRTRSRSGSNSAEKTKNEKSDTINKKNKKTSRKSKSGERSSKSRKHKKLKSKKSKYKSKSKQRKEKSHHRKHSHGNEDTDSDISEEKDIEVKSLEDDVESLENLVQKLQQAQGVNENDEQSALGKQNQLHRIRNLPLPKKCSASGSESDDSAKTPDMASDDSDETVCGKSSGEEETWEELKLKWEKKLKTKQKS